MLSEPFDTDALTRALLLAAELPAGDAPQSLRCKRCRSLLGAVANSRGVAVGQFEADPSRFEDGTISGVGSRLASSAVLVGSRVILKCTRCRHENRWQPSP